MFRKAGKTAQDLMEQSTDAVLQSNQYQGGRFAALASGFAILFSAVSLYQTVLKQASLHIYIPDTLSYTRDPYGAFEVFIVPVSIVNSGAQDGIVTSLRLEVTNRQTQVKRVFFSNYSVDGTYFSIKSDYSKKLKRPKKPFAPLPVTGRGNFSGTLLFYPKAFSAKRVLGGAGKYDMKVTMETTPLEDLGVLDRVMRPRLSPVSFQADLPKISRYFEGQMLSGGTVRLFRTSLSKAKKPRYGKPQAKPVPENGKTESKGDNALKSQDAE